MKITTYSISGDIMDCESCGWHNEETYLVYLDDVLIYKYYTDNHLHIEVFPDTDLEIWELLLNAIEDKLIEGAESEYSEQRRIEWNKEYPGNYVASTPESWLKNKEDRLSYLYEDIQKVGDILSENAPSSGHLQIKLLLLWLEDSEITIEYIQGD